jgi:diketogulonate reductase-like aldo/keto reductase
MPIPGTTSIAHIRENLDAEDVELSREDIQSINNFAPEGTAEGSAVDAGTELPLRGYRKPRKER